MVFHNELSQPTSLWSAAGREHREREFLRRRGPGGRLSRDLAAHASTGATSTIQQKREVPLRKSMGKRRGPDYYAQIGLRCDGAVRKRRGPEFYAGIGREAAGTTLDPLGIAHYERIGRMGGLRARRQEREAHEGNQ